MKFPFMRRRQEQVEAEIQSHLRMAADDRIERGETPAHAEQTARREFGNVGLVREATRDSWGWRWLEDLAYDIRYGAHLLRRNPGFAIVAVLTLALGIGANTAIFSALDAVMLRLLPVKDPQRLIMLDTVSKGFPGDFVDDIEATFRDDKATGFDTTYAFSYSTFADLRDHNHVFDSTLAFAGNDLELNLGLNGRAESAAGQGVSGNYFEALGVPAFLGRTIAPEHDQTSASPTAVVSYDFWRRQLGQDPSVVGKPIIMNGIPVVVVGVAPPEFFGLEPGASPDFWVPLSFYSWEQDRLGYSNNGTSYIQDPRTWWLQIVGRLKSGTSETEARAELTVLFEQSIKRSAGSAALGNKIPRLGSFSVKQGLDDLRTKFSTALLLLMAMVGLVLLIACANVAGLLLAQASAREREMGVRIGLGAGRLRLIRQLLAESVFLAVLGGAVGLLFAVWANSILMALLTSGPPEKAPGSFLNLELHLNGSVLGFTGAVSIFCGILFGLVPAFRASHVEPVAALKQSAATQGVLRRLVSGKLLVGGQVALSFLLLVSAGLFLRTLQKLQTIDIGFDRQHLLLFTVRPGLNGYKGARLAGYYQELQRRIKSIPGVRFAGFSDRAPIGGGTGRSTGLLPGYTPPGQRAEMYRHIVEPEYFDAVGIPKILGRVIGPQDTQAAPHVAVINRKMAETYFHNDDPLGHHIQFGSARHPRDFEIVGVVGNAKYNQLRTDTPPTAYFSYLQWPEVINSFDNFMTFEVRSQGAMPALTGAIRRSAQAIDKNVPLVDVRTETEVIDRTLFLERAFAQLSSSFGLLALVLACVGLYGTMAYAVAQRTKEIGIRIALGAASGSIFRMMLRDIFLIVLSGLALGLPAAWAATRLLRTQLFGLSPHDPFTFLLATWSIIIVGLLAGYIPARRAARVDPMVALRYE